KRAPNGAKRPCLSGGACDHDSHGAARPLRRLPGDTDSLGGEAQQPQHAARKSQHAGAPRGPEGPLFPKGLPSGGLGAGQVDRLDAKAMDADLEESPFVSYLRLRPPKPVEEKPEPPLEQNLREDVLKTKKQLLEVALRMEMLASDPETAEETALRLRRLRKAQRRGFGIAPRLASPPRLASLPALSGSEEPSPAASNLHRHLEVPPIHSISAVVT
ncbi:unnamed protein product, partial [Effrenium voratum]